MKIGYDHWEEGLGFIFRGELAELRWLPISESRSYENWRTRMALLLKRRETTDWFCNLHMGWWDDEADPFLGQWGRLKSALPRSESLWLMGDFNASPDVKGQGYDAVASGGFYDCFTLANRTKGEETVMNTKLDGWQEREAGVMRIDQIWCRYPARIERCFVCMNGKDGPVASDHCGVCVETGER
jgi:maltose 6'-phosphate phosphatase